MSKKTLFRTVFMITSVVIALALAFPVQATKGMTAQDLVKNCKKEIKTIKVTDAKTLFDSGKHLFLDVRTATEFKKGSIPNAIHLQRGVLEFKIDKKVPDKASQVVIYCKSGSRATLSSCALKKLGYDNVLMMDGGWEAWLKEGYPIN